jgi:hypothetical protein
MKEKRLVGISLYIMFLPTIVFLSIKLILLLPNFYLVHSLAHPFRFLNDYAVFGGSWRTSWFRVDLYTILGMWISYSSNAARLGAIVLTATTALWGIMELITILFSLGPLIYSYVTKVYGFEDIILLGFIETLFVVANIIAVFYLTRPKLKAFFK